MTKVSWRWWALGLGCGLLATSTFAQNPTISIFAVMRNPKCLGGDRNGRDCVLAPDCPGGACAPDAAHGAIAATDTLAVVPGDVIVTEMFAFDYSPAGEKLLAYQFETEDFFASSVRSGASVLEAPRHCASKSDCSFIGVATECIAGVCAEVPSDPPDPSDSPIDPRAGSVNIDTTRFDFVFFLPSAFVNVDLSSVPVRFLGALGQANDSQVYPGAPQYLGTVAYKVEPEMCGTVVIALTPEPDTVLIQRGGDFISPVDLLPLTLTGPSGLACLCLNIVDSDPPNCVIEARQPSNPDGSDVVVLNSMRLRLDCPDASGVADSPGSFLVRELRGGGLANIVNSVVVDPADKSWVTLTFGRTLRTERWTCTSFGSDEVCVGLLAGDVNADSLVGDEDIVGLAGDPPTEEDPPSCLRTPGTCTLRQCDADRSQLCTPADILRVIDIINGGGAFASLGVDMGIITTGGAPIACPTLPPTLP